MTVASISPDGENVCPAGTAYLTTCLADVTAYPVGVTAYSTNVTSCLAAVTTYPCTTQHAAFWPSLLSGSSRSKVSLNAPLGSIEDYGMKIVSGRTWREDQKMEDEVMTQSLERNPTSICIDSGAGESVCPVESFPDYETHTRLKKLGISTGPLVGRN